MKTENDVIELDEEELLEGVRWTSWRMAALALQTYLGRPRTNLEERFFLQMKNNNREY